MKPHDYVLVVDDFADGREMVAEYLTFRGLSVVTASEGAEALRIARERPPAVVLMDLTMPGVDGWEATRRLKADPRTAESIVIALTAHALVHDEGRALEAGADAFVAKPFDLSLLADALTSILANGRASLNDLPVIGFTPLPAPPRAARGTRRADRSSRTAGRSSGRARTGSRSAG